MTSAEGAFRAPGAKEWTRERVERLSGSDIRQLQANAERLNEPELVALCGEVLKSGPREVRGVRGKASPRPKARKLIARVRAFEARGVYLRHPATSWGGVRKSDGAVVLALWADAIESAEGGCRYLLWAPNIGGARPWSDLPAGRERLEHCELALARGRAEGLLVYGQTLAGRLPEERAYAVNGVDAETVVAFSVERIGEEYWATWGKKSPQKESIG